MKIIYLVYVMVMGTTSLVSAFEDDEDRQLFDALQLALINDSTNLYILQKLFYPPGGILPDTVELASRIEVYTISSPIKNRCDGTAALYHHEYYNVYYRQNRDKRYIHCDVDYFTISNDAFSDSQVQLKTYINFIKDILEMLEYITYNLIMKITSIQFSAFASTNYVVDIPRVYLKVDKLEFMPCEQEYIEAMSLLLSWARYYAKMYNHDPLKEYPAKLDTDRGIIYRNVCGALSNEDAIEKERNTAITINYLLSILIAIVGIYCLNLFITKYESYRHTNSTRNVFNSIYWASVIIAGVINIVGLVKDIIVLVKGTIVYSRPGYFEYAVAYLKIWTDPPLGLLLFLVETVAVFIMVKKFRISSCVCGCCSRPLVMRLAHTLAICHLLWFLHRVGSGLIVAAFFIALAPGQTIAALSLMYLVILVSTVYVTCCIYSIQNRKKKCKMVCKLFFLTIAYLCMVGLAICFTLIYIELSKHGLTSSTLGSILLSLIPPMAVFFIGVVIRRQLKDSNILEINPSDSFASDSSVSDEVRDQVKLDERTPLV